MLHILLLILKIIGIVLLVLAGILLAAVLLVLFVPVRYRIDGNFDGNPSGAAVVSWLLHLVTARMTFDGKAVLQIKVLWFGILKEQLWPEEEGTGDSEFGDLEEDEDSEELMVHTTELSAPEDEPGQKESGTEGVPAPKEESETAEHPEDSQAENPKKNMKLPASDQIRKIPEKIRCTFRKICDKLKEGQQTCARGKAFIQNEENQKTIKLLFSQIKKLLRQLLPRKIRGRIRFGFDDPYNTGQVLSAVSPFYGLYARSLVLEPVFDEKILEGALHIRGHIRIASLLWIGVRVLFNKNFRKLLRKWRK